MTSTALKFTNHENSPHLDQLIQMFYHGTATESIGIMQALNKNTNKEELVLVGVRMLDDIPSCYPLAKILTEEEASVYLSPDGVGGFIDGEEEIVNV